MPELQPCGTIAACRRHRRRGEKPCAPCLAAEAQRKADDLQQDQEREGQYQAEYNAMAWPTPEPYQPPAGIPPGGSVAWYFADQLDRLPDHDGTILFVARLLAPCIGRLPPQTLDAAALRKRQADGR